MLSESDVRSIVREEILQYITKPTEQPKKTKTITKTFSHNNPEQLEVEINVWLENVGGKLVKEAETKDPLSAMGIIKTLYVEVPEEIAD